MKNLSVSIFLPIALVTISILPAQASEIPTSEVQIAGAVSPAPEDLRDGAAVLGYAEGKDMVTLREGKGDLICLADKPGDKRFHAACYFKALEPFMARGRALRAQGIERAKVLETREAEIASGKIAMPEHIR